MDKGDVHRPHVGSQPETLVASVIFDERVAVLNYRYGMRTDSSILEDQRAYQNIESIRDTLPPLWSKDNPKSIGIRFS